MDFLLSLISVELLIVVFGAIFAIYLVRKVNKADEELLNEVRPIAEMQSTPIELRELSSEDYGKIDLAKLLRAQNHARDLVKAGALTYSFSAVEQQSTCAINSALNKLIPNRQSRKGTILALWIFVISIMVGGKNWDVWLWSLMGVALVIVIWLEFKAHSFVLTYRRLVSESQTKRQASDIGPRETTVAEQLKSIVELKSAGALSEEEFSAAKSKILENKKIA